MSKRGIAKKEFRVDAGVFYDPFGTLGMKQTKRKRMTENRPQAAAARERMTDRQEENESPFMDSIVDDYMGGRDAASKQAASYEQLFDDIKTGKYNTLAAAARERMISRENGGHPDIGRDRANRRAYPAK
jgi:hypothetical protein